ncbi:MAG: hypothetical protein M1438_00895 [Deltaproteobacteria bacterium]|nr:hypothetical protein [Deltaproteobacteria bacterium]
MKPRTGEKIAIFLALSLTAMLVLGGCATTTGTKPEPVSVTQIVEMSKSKVPPQDIINQIKTSGTVYRLDASQLADLRQAGVSDQVINYMQQTYLEAVRRNQERLDWYYWSPGVGGYWYGGVPYGWR